MDGLSWPTASSAWADRKAATIIVVSAVSLAILSLHLFSRGAPKETKDDDVQAADAEKYPLYEYEAFNDAEREIRLLYLPAKSKTRETGTAYRLRTFPIDKAPRYEAISYTWGDRPMESFIVVDTKAAPRDDVGESIKVLRVSAKVRHILRSRIPYQRARWVWIDSVCINQGDDDEKSAQVTLMGNIYMHCSKTVICLEEPEGPPIRLGAVLSLMDEMAVYIKQYANKPFDSLDHMSLVGSPYSWHAFARLLLSPYWWRVWIMQECVLPKKVLIFTGDSTVEWDQLQSRMAALLTVSPGALIVSTMFILAGLSVPDLNEVSDSMLQMHSLSSLRGQGTRSDATLLSLLYTSRNARCKDPRDKIFGLYGMLGTAKGAPRSLPPEARPNYTIPTLKLYTDLARIFYQTEPASVLSLSGIGYTRVLKELPSWAPDWTSVPNIFGILPSAIYNAGGPLENSTLGDFQSRFTEDTPPCLVLPQAYRVGVLKEALPQALRPGADIVPFVLDAVQLISKHLPESIESLTIPQGAAKAPQNDALWRTLIRDYILDADLAMVSPAPGDYGRIFAAFYRAAKRDPYLHLRTTEDTFPVYKETNEFLRRLSNSVGRSFGFTEDGVLAMVPPLALPGDEFFVVKGFRMPLLLRHTESEIEGAEREYKLLGHVYLHGMMTGEGVSHDSSQASQLRVI